MKMKYFLPLALVSMMLTPAVFAAASPEASSTMTLTNPQFINITVTETVKASGATFDDAYSKITLSTPFDVTFNVVNNVKDRPIYLSAKVTSAGGSTEALGGTTANPVLAFANAGTNKPTSEAVGNAINGSAAIESNANVIAFTLAPTITPSEAASGQPTASIASNKITYTISNGKYTFRYLAGENQTPGTFSTHDQDGTYTSVLTMSSTGP